MQVTALRWLEENWHRSDVFVLNMPVGCHAKGQGILMRDGTIKVVEDIQVGDILQGPDGPRRVLNLHRGRQEMARITPTKGEPFVVNLDHVLALYRTANKGHSGTYLTATVRQYLEMPKSVRRDMKLYRTGVEYAETDVPLPMPAYVFGLWLGDGTRGLAAITKTPGAWTDAWEAWGAQLGCYTCRQTKPDNRASTFSLSTARGQPNPALDALRATGAAQDKHIPIIYLTATRAQRQELFAGLMDSDGHASRAGFDYISVSPKLANNVAQLARSLGLAAYVKPCVKGIRSAGFTGNYYRVSISGDMSSYPFLRHKLEPRRQKKSVMVTGFDVQLLPPDDYYGFEVDADNLYLLDDFTVTHNSGKSYVAETIKRTTGGHILTPTNLLIDQYIDTYPHANFLKGKDHYACKSGLSCADWVDTCEMEPCAECPYVAAKARAASEPTFFNPMSYWYFGYSQENAPLPKALVVDEAHGLSSFLSMLAGVRLRKSEYGFSDACVHEVALCLWLDETVARLGKLREAYRGNRREYLRISTEMKQLSATRRGVEEAPENYAIWIEPGHYRGKAETFLNVKPVTLPRYIADRALAAEKVVLLSGTLPETDVRELVGDRPYLYLDLPSPIPVERRRVFSDPLPFKVNFETPPKKLAAAIADAVAAGQGNALVHVSYDLCRKVRPHLPDDWHANPTADLKDQALDNFKSMGGVFLAAGCAEGLDLKGNLCRHNIIPKLIYPNLGDPVVKKRRAMADGEEWYALRTLTTLIQQVGRSTRSETDGSVARVLDPNFARLYSRWKHKLPASFREAVIWRRPTMEDFKVWQ